MDAAVDPSSGLDKDSSASEEVELDPNGLPLLPQPSSSPYDPLNYPNWLKYAILAEVSLLAFLATLNVAIINPAVVPLAEEFNIGHVTATYQTTVAIGTSSLGPLLFTPFANVYGRRSAYLLSVLIGFASAVGSAKAKSFGTLVVARAFNGFGPSAALGLGAGTVVDLFFEHQRGKAMGIFTLMLTNGAHLAPIVGGYVARDRGWRWCFWVGAILNGIMFIFAFFLMPETLFDRPREESTDKEVLEHVEKIEENAEISVVGRAYEPPALSFKDYLHRMWFWDLDRPASRRIKASDFVIKPLSMLKYPSVVFPALYYAVTYGFASIEPALTLATLFTEFYHFDTVRNGLANGVSLLVGASLGELLSGPVTDAMMVRARRRALKRGETAPAEVRLHGIWTGAITVPADGLTIHFATTFIAPCIGMAVACFGIQIVTSVCYTYSCSDCYRSRSNDVSQCFNFFRQIFGLTLGFYSIPFGDKIGFEWSFAVFALICVVTFLLIVALMYKGEKWRHALGRNPIRHHNSM
ncbi:major facilitator superfamily domain-containing protein [Gymnopilus junonius]|uniref:Major facilitator superfamily domain-containing protein n=1 Tax=Gymnopilus junonius TaxID=109634 RepID=A0A9P5P1K1_GYMJU|nr:major facilitator superfamily domain-containing protein [Gymnopilus junonius]